MIFTSSSKVVFVGFQPSSVFAFAGSPQRFTTSVGRENSGETLITVFPVALSIPTSSIPSPLNSSSMQPRGMRAHRTRGQSAAHRLRSRNLPVCRSVRSATYIQHSLLHNPSHAGMINFQGRAHPVCPGRFLLLQGRFFWLRKSHHGALTHG